MGGASEASTSTAGARRRKLACFALVLVALLATLWAYAPCLDNFFVADDFCYLLVGRTILAQPATIVHQGALFRLYGGADMRPLGNLLWGALVGLFGYRPAPYYLFALGCHLLNGWLLWHLFRRWLRDELVAVVAPALFLTAYGVRNGVCWLSNLNEPVGLLCGLLALHITLHARGWRLRGPALTVLLVGGCLIKESVAPLLPVCLMLDRLTEPERSTWRAYGRRWLPVVAIFGLYAAIRILGRGEDVYAGYGLGPHVFRSWPVLVSIAFTSDILPVFLERALQAPELLPLIAWTITAILIWLAVRGDVPVRVMAAWVLVQPVPYALVSAPTLAIQPHYCYVSTAPAMALVAMALSSLYRRSRGRPALLAATWALGLCLCRWTLWGLERTRMDERLHWDVASRSLRRDFAVFDAAQLRPGTHLILVMPPEQRPAGGTWWGWGGYPLLSRAPVTIEEVPAPPTETGPPPYAVFAYDKEQGPKLVARNDGPAE